jgi:hypothetical protein
MLKDNANYWKPKRFRRAWHIGYSDRLTDKCHRGNPYRGGSDEDYVAWRNGYYAACNECTNEHERLMRESSHYREDFEFLAMRAYWQGLHWDIKRFTESDTNPYLDAQEPNQALINAWYQGRRDA